MSSPERQPHPRHREVYAAWVSTAEATYGERPATGGTHGGRIAASIAALLAAYGGDADRALATMRRAVQDRRRPTIHQIARDPDGYGPIVTTRPAPAPATPTTSRLVGITHPDQLRRSAS